MRCCCCRCRHPAVSGIGPIVVDAAVHSVAHTGLSVIVDGAAGHTVAELDTHSSLRSRHPHLSTLTELDRCRRRRCPRSRFIGTLVSSTPPLTALSRQQDHPGRRRHPGHAEPHGGTPRLSSSTPLERLLSSGSTATLSVPTQSDRSVSTPPGVSVLLAGRCRQ